MKSYIREFNYVTKAGKKSKRRVFVMRETADAFDGFDLGHLDGSQKRAVRRLFKAHEVSNVITNKPNEDVPKNTEVEALMKAAWRRFNKASCI
jgi:hypothetical protein